MKLSKLREAIRLDPKLHRSGTAKDLLSPPRESTMRPSGHYNEAIRLDPKRASPGATKDLLSTAQGKYDEAIRAYNEAIGLDPNCIARNNKGFALNYLGEYDEAIRAFDEAIRLDPSLHSAWERAYLRPSEGTSKPMPASPEPGSWQQSLISACPSARILPRSPMDGPASPHAHASASPNPVDELPRYGALTILVKWVWRHNLMHPPFNPTTL